MNLKERILDAMRDGEYQNAAELAAALGASHKSVMRALCALCDSGAVEFKTVNILKRTKLKYWGFKSEKIRLYRLKKREHENQFEFLRYRWTSE